VRAVELLARTDRTHAATVDQWDPNQLLLNTPAGVIDLVSGKLRPASREDFCTKMTAVAPGPASSLWLKFLDEVTDGNKRMQKYLQRVCG
jgi:putative DNA primase/helicase